MYPGLEPLRRLEWLAWYDRQVCADPDVLAVALDTGLGTGPESAPLQSFIDWYADYVGDRFSEAALHEGDPQ